MPPTPVLCGIGCQRAASRPRPSSSAAAGPQLDAGCACPCAAQSARRKRAEGGGGPAVADRQHRACSSPAAAADGRRATGRRRVSRAGRAEQSDSRRPLRRRPEVGARMLMPMDAAARSSGAREQWRRQNRTPWAARALRARLSLCLVTVVSSTTTCSVPVRAGSTTRRLSPRLSQPGRNLPPPAGPPAAPPRRPHYPSAAALRVTFAPGCCSSFLPSAQLSSPPPPPLGSRPANASGLDHTTLSIPHLVRSGKSSSVGRG